MLCNAHSSQAYIASAALIQTHPTQLVTILSVYCYTPIPATSVKVGTLQPGMSSLHKSDVPDLCLVCCAEDYMSGMSRVMFRIHAPDQVALQAQLMLEGNSANEVAALLHSYFRYR